jgi:hypothetical protein
MYGCDAFEKTLKSTLKCEDGVRFAFIRKIQSGILDITVGIFFMQMTFFISIIMCDFFSWTKKQGMGLVDFTQIGRIYLTIYCKKFVDIDLTQIEV